jgi:small redox-active disulfide protein 2
VDAVIKKIEVLGPGCSRCQETYRVVRHVVESAGLSCEVIKVESYQRIAELGVMATPAIAIDGGVVLAGRVPKTDEVRALLGLA